MSRTSLPGPALRRAGATVVLVLALGSLSACGDDDTDDVSGDTSSGSSATESDSATEAPGDGVDGATPAPSGGEQIDPAEFVDVYRASLDNATTTHLTMAVEGGPAAVDIEGDGDFTTDPPSFSFEIDDPTTGQTQSMVLADGDLYFQLPQLKGTYAKTDLATAGLGSGTDLLDPSALVDTLADGITEARSYGPEDVDGEQLDHYSITVDSQTLIDASGSGADELPEGTIPDALTYDVYFDADHLRRISAELGEQGGAIDVRYDDWGAPVDITVPDPEDVQRLPGS